MIKRCIIHPGSAHRDELIAVGIAMNFHLINMKTPVHRREPTEQELEDPDVLVLDVGNRYEPEKNNFDHHQLPRGTQECAASLLAKHCRLLERLDDPISWCTYHDLFKDAPWYKTTIILDSMGPYVLAKEMGIKELPPGLISPFESSITDYIEKVDKIPEWVMMVLYQTVDCKVTAALRFRAALRALEQGVKILDIGGLTSVLYDGDAFGLESWLKSKGLNPAISITRDDRGPGWSLYRFDDHPRVDFSKLNGNPLVGFAHVGGFIAKTQDIAADEAVRLCQEALIQ